MDELDQSCYTPNSMPPSPTRSPKPRPPASLANLKPPWKPGHTGNARGRPASPYGSIRAYLHARFGPDAQRLIDLLVGIAEKARTTDQLAAIKELLARHSGSAPQSLDVTSGGRRLGSGWDLRALADTDLRALIMIESKARTQLPAHEDDGASDAPDSAE